MYRPQDSNAGASQQHGFLSASTPSSSFSQTQFPSPLFALDPSLHSSPQLLHPGFARQQTPERRVPSTTQGSMQPPSTSSPQLNRSTSASSLPGASRPQDRSLPATNVSARSITDAYVAFILYCNPHFKLDIDTETLRTTFNTPPKSDNKEFQTFTLFDLIRKLNSKEIKTWGQLALDLGVEAPDVNKGQSVQKVQQYTVRLKRWMRAMHIDAFFEYLLGNHHTYFTDLPQPNDPFPVGGRDGVQAEEDLAIRALDPAFRPKRGRRRNSEADQDDEADAGLISKQPRLDAGPANTAPMSAYPPSAHPDAFHDPWAIASAVTPATFAPWANKQDGAQTAVSTTAPSHLRWQLHGNGQQIATPHPMTAQPTSMAAHIEAAFENEAKSAVTPAKRKRKHGPAVSSAWPSAGGPGAKPRGRPPASRNVQDGPFGTFPVDPSNEKNANPSKSGTPDVKLAEARCSAPPATAPPQAPRPPIMHRQSDGPGRPGRLSLQVPQHTGAPVRLATPPQLLVNGETNDSEGQSSTHTPLIEQAPELPAAQRPTQRVIGNMQVSEREIPGFAFEALKRVLTTDILRAELVGRHQRLNGDEAKRLADAVLVRMGVPKADTESSQDDIARLTAASWLGLGGQLNVPLGPATSTGPTRMHEPRFRMGPNGYEEVSGVFSRSKSIAVTRFRMDAEGYEEIVSANEPASEDEVREVFDMSWTASIGGCNGFFELKGLSLGPHVPMEADTHDMIIQRVMAAVKRPMVDGDRELAQALRAGAVFKGRQMGNTGDDGIDWKTRAMSMEFGSRLAVGEMQKCKEMLLEKVLDILL